MKITSSSEKGARPVRAANAVSEVAMLAKPAAQKPAGSTRPPRLLTTRELAESFKALGQTPSPAQLVGWHHIVQSTYRRVVEIQTDKWPSTLQREYLVGLALLAGEFAAGARYRRLHQAGGRITKDVDQSCESIDDPYFCVALALFVPAYAVPQLVAAKLRPKNLKDSIMGLVYHTIKVDELLQHLPRGNNAKTHGAFDAWLKRTHRRNA